MTSPESPEEIRRDEEEANVGAELFYPNVQEFVTDRLVYFVARPRPASGRAWCPEWYRHPQALSRLDSVWRAWEFLRSDPALGMSSWWTNHLDPNMRALMDAVTGPFAGCADGHQPEEPLPSLPAPDKLFSDQRLRQPLADDPLALG